MMLQNCSQCKHWPKAMRQYNKKHNKPKDCNRYGICDKYPGGDVEYDTYDCNNFVKSKILSIKQWIFKHFGIAL